MAACDLCGHENPAGTAACGGCGEPLRAAVGDDRTAGRVRLGRRLVLAAIAATAAFVIFNFAYSVIRQTNDRGTVQVLRAVLFAGLSVFLYRGRRWARLVFGGVALFAAVACVVAVGAGMTFRSNWYVTVVMGPVYGGIAAVLLLSGSVRDFQAAQRGETARRGDS